MKHWTSAHQEIYESRIVGLKNSQCDVEVGEVDSPVETLYTPHMICSSFRSRSVENYSVVTKEKLQYFEAEIRPAYVS